MRIKMIAPLLFVMFAACKQELEISNENVAGTWKVKAFENDIPNIPEDVNEAGRKEFLSSVYTLKNDFSMEMHSDFFSDGAQGHWELNPEKKEITMSYSYGTDQGDETYNIAYLSKNKMILHQVVEANEYNGYVQLTLEK